MSPCPDPGQHTSHFPEWISLAPSVSCVYKAEPPPARGHSLRVSSSTQDAARSLQPTDDPRGLRAGVRGRPRQPPPAQPRAGRAGGGAPRHQPRGAAGGATAGAQDPGQPQARHRHGAGPQQGRRGRQGAADPRRQAGRGGARSPGAAGKQAEI